MRVTGTMINYYFVCKRKLWYSYNKINLEQNSELVKMGKVLDETSYDREKHNFLIEDIANIDFLKRGIVHEIKKSNSEIDASIYQVKYYLYLLNKRGFKDIKGKIDFVLTKKNIEVLLENEDIIMIEKIVDDIKNILDKEVSPEQELMAKCKKCAYYDFCLI